VDSLVVRILFDPLPVRVLHLPPHDHQLLKQLVKAAFQQRRKTLLNSLSATIHGGDKMRVARLLEQAGIDPRVRAERLTVEDFVRLANVYAGDVVT